MKRDEDSSLALCLAFGSATLGQSFVAPGVSVADLGLALSALLVVRQILQGKLGFSVPRWSYFVFLWFAWSLVGGLVRSVWSPLPFSGVEFLKSLAKLGFYSVGACLLALLQGRLSSVRVKELVLWVLTINAAIALYIYVVMTAGWDLPYHFFWIGSVDAQHALSWGGAAYDQPLVRARGLAGEPSYFGIFQLLGLAVVYTKGSFGTGRHRWREAVVMISILLTFSLSVYLLLGLFGVLVGWRANRRGVPVVSHVLIPALLLLAVLAAIPSIRNSAAELIGFRIAMASSGSPDTSVELRTNVNWEVTREIVRRVPVFGAGLGNYEVAWEGLQPHLEAAPRYPPEQGWNGIFYAIATTGLVGGLLFALVLVAVWRTNSAGGILLAAALGATSAILSAPFWLLLTLLATSSAPAAQDRHR